RQRRREHAPVETGGELVGSAQDLLEIVAQRRRQTLSRREGRARGRRAEIETKERELSPRSQQIDRSQHYRVDVAQRRRARARAVEGGARRLVPVERYVEPCRGIQRSDPIGRLLQEVVTLFEGARVELFVPVGVDRDEEHARLEGERAALSRGALDLIEPLV